jgi:hypothetical protein
LSGRYGSLTGRALEAWASLGIFLKQSPQRLSLFTRTPVEQDEIAALCGPLSLVGDKRQRGDNRVIDATVGQMAALIAPRDVLRVWPVQDHRNVRRLGPRRPSISLAHDVAGWNDVEGKQDALLFFLAQPRP